MPVNFIVGKHASFVFQLAAFLFEPAQIEQELIVVFVSAAPVAILLVMASQASGAAVT